MNKQMMPFNYTDEKGTTHISASSLVLSCTSEIYLDSKKAYAPTARVVIDEPTKEIVNVEALSKILKGGAGSGGVDIRSEFSEFKNETSAILNSVIIAYTNLKPVAFIGYASSLINRDYTHLEDDTDYFVRTGYLEENFPDNKEVSELVWSQRSEINSKIDTEVSELSARHDFELSELISKHDTEVSEIYSTITTEVSELRFVVTEMKEEAWQAHANLSEKLNKVSETDYNRYLTEKSERLALASDVNDLRSENDFDHQNYDMHCTMVHGLVEDPSIINLRARPFTDGTYVYSCVSVNGAQRYGWIKISHDNVAENFIENELEIIK